MATWRVNNSALLGGEVLSVWQASHTYSVGARCVATYFGSGFPTSQTRVFRCSSGGMSGGSEPTWTTTVGGSTTDNAVTWITETPSDGNWDNATLLYFAANRCAAVGDTILVSHAHAEYQNTYTTLTFPGTIASPNKIICVDKATELKAIGAVYGSNIGSASLYLQGDFYSYGIKWTSAYSMALCNAGYGYSREIFEMDSPTTIALDVATNSSYNGYLYGGSTTGGYAAVINGAIKLGQANSYMQVGPLYMEWMNGKLIAPNELASFISTYAGGSLRCSGVDLSELCTGATTKYFFNGATGGTYSQFDRCKLPSGSGFTWVYEAVYPLQAQGPMDHEVVLHHCASDNTSYRFKLLSLNGQCTEETTIVRSGGANNGVTSFSCKMETTAKTIENTFGCGLKSIPIHGWLSGASSQTISVECIVDSATNLQNDEVWLELKYASDNTSGLGDVANNKCGYLETPADVTASAASWTTTGMSNPNEFKLSVTIDPGKIGPFEAKVVLSKRSTTIYVDPMITVS